jgi:hypothetical protein
VDAITPRKNSEKKLDLPPHRGDIYLNIKFAQPRLRVSTENREFSIKRPSREACALPWAWLDALS